MTTPHGSPELAVSQASKEATVNEQIRRTEAGANFYLVEDRGLSSPPGSCADGATYIVSGSGSGAWAGHGGDIAIAVGANASNGWYFRDSTDGLAAWVKDEGALLIFDAFSSPPGWTPYDPGLGALDLDDLADVSITSAANGDLLVFNGTNWVNKTRAGGDIGYLGAPQINDSDDYTLTLADAGKHYYHPAGAGTHTLTIPANASVAFPIGTVIVIVNENGAGALSVAITSDTLRWGSSTGTRSLAANGVASLLKVASTVWRMTGDGIT